ncbi:UDP-N-acetylenolpyruvoylglucosamine reductase [Cutibacterium acnes JCM 18920]|nr:UDP-N-acetylenolpyruvoylglucosamine reductase [Cutibacterium acnes JCM 18920]
MTNRGGASSGDLITLARTVIGGVRDAYGITLVPEPRLIGCTI